jgi:hypothetical protein
MTTQAELWVRMLGIVAETVTTDHRMQAELNRLKADYPHIVQILTKDGERIGTRRLFNDRSIVDQFLNQPGKYHVDTLTEGRAGFAHNGSPILTLH